MSILVVVIAGAAFLQIGIETAQVGAIAEAPRPLPSSANTMAVANSGATQTQRNGSLAGAGDSMAAQVAHSQARRTPPTDWGTPAKVILPPPRKVDPAQEAELSGLEEEASRHAAGLGKDSEALEEALRGLQPNPGESPDEFAQRAEDERRRLLANAYLVEATAREALEAGIFPAGFPAEERAQDSAQALVNAYESNSDAKIAWLRRALDAYGSMSTPVDVQYQTAKPLPSNSDGSTK